MCIRDSFITDAYMTQNSQVTWEWLLINRPEVAQMYIAQYGELAKSMIDKGMLNTAEFLTGPPGSSPTAADGNPPPPTLLDRMKEEREYLEKLPGARVELRGGVDRSNTPDGSYVMRLEVPRTSGGQLEIIFDCPPGYPKEKPIVDVLVNGQPTPFQSTALNGWRGVEYLTEVARDIRQRLMIDKGMLNTTGSDDLPLRLDAAVPDTVALHQSFDLAVAVRREESPLLQEEELTRVRSAAVQVEWPVEVTAVDLRVHVHAPDCYITGQPFQLFRLRAGQDSPVVYFSLTPQRLGDIPIRVTLFQAFLAVGSARLTARADEHEVGRLITHVSSHLRPVAQSDEWTGIYTLISRTFSLEEFETLCFQMSIDPDDLAGTTRQRKIGALVDFCRRRELIESLAAHVLAARPNWMDLLVGGLTH